MNGELKMYKERFDKILADATRRLVVIWKTYGITEGEPFNQTLNVIVEQEKEYKEIIKELYQENYELGNSQ